MGKGKDVGMEREVERGDEVKMVGGVKKREGLWREGRAGIGGRERDGKGCEEGGRGMDGKGIGNDGRGRRDRGRGRAGRKIEEWRRSRD